MWKRFAPGRFARSIPNAMGRRRSGSNFLPIARYISIATITYMAIVFKNPMSSAPPVG